MSTTASADEMLSAIERSGYYPGIVADAVFSAIGVGASRLLLRPS